VQGFKVGKSLVEEEFLDTARGLLDKAKRQGVPVYLPQDHLVGSEFSENASATYVAEVDIPDGAIGMDIGEKTVQRCKEIIARAKTVVWNGPLGVFEFPAFAKGTLEVAKAVAACGGTTVVGGGDIVAALSEFGLTDRITHVSTGGGASLEFLEGKSLPGIAALQDRK
jgi:phosphoglycerate kinase